MTAQAGSRRRVVMPQPAGSGRLSRAASTVPLRETRTAATRTVRGPQRERHEPDHLVLVVTLALAAMGLLMVYSTTGVATAIQNQGDPFGGIATQLGFSVLGVLALVVFMRLDYRYLRLVSVPAFLVAVALLVVVLLPAIGPLRPIIAGGSARWLQIGSLPAMHPAELAKLAMVIYLAHWLAKRGTQAGSLLHGLVPFLVICGPVIALVAAEPDLGTTGVLALTAFTVFFVAGGSIWQLAMLAPVGLAALATYVMNTGYQLARVETFLDPWADPLERGFQTVQGLYALGIGGVFGIGLGQSRLPGGLVLPNAQNDFIFAVIGQEFGMIGAVAVIGLFLLLAYRGVRIALGAPDTFAALLATGITAWLCFQALINIGVVVALLPITGITLPFVSDGGSSLVVSFAAVGILLSISRETLPRGTWNDADPDRGRGYGRPHLPGPGRPPVVVRARR
ncbi:MAG: cell division protein FtsW [Chloroflexi bacterium]|nr:cell division protein FtsW [Chloroflexota bacterium]